MKLRWLCALLVIAMLFPMSALGEATLLSLPDGDVAYEPYRLYLDVSDAMSRYGARQAIVFSLAAYSYLSANGILLDEEGFEAQAGQALREYLASKTHQEICALVTAQFDMTQAQVEQSVRAEYWSQYIASLLAAYFRAAAQADSSDAQTLFDDFESLFLKNLDLSDPGYVAVFAGEAVEWTEDYDALIRYNGALGRIKAANAIGENEALERFATKNDLFPDEEAVAENLLETVRIMQADTSYYAHLKRALSSLGVGEDAFYDALTPFVHADLCRAALGRYCFERSRADESIESAQAYYEEQLASLTEGMRLVTLVSP